MSANSGNTGVFTSQTARTFFLAIPFALASAGMAADDSQLDDDGKEVVYYDGPMKNGQLTGGQVLMPIPEIDITAGGYDAPSTTILDNGPPANRIDIAIVGDGYLESQLGTYASNAQAGINAFFAMEPFQSYESFFNVHRVDVVSPVAGVDHDPTYPIWRNTTLDMGFFCSGIERLLCVNVSKAHGYAANAPDADQVLAIANSSKYGGAGYSSSNLATFAGRNSSATQVAIHELGHSLGNLADEYDYGGGTYYQGGEPWEPNVSTLTASEMQATGTKWADWLGVNDSRYDGLVNTYEGARYYQFDIYRPTRNSMMRALNRPFNLPSIESFIIEFYKIVKPIDDSTPTNGTLNGTETVFVVPLDPASHDLDIEWMLDDDIIEGTSRTTVDLSKIQLSTGEHWLTVQVTDNTDFVRDEISRQTYLSQSLVWHIVVERRTAELQSVVMHRGILIDGDVSELIDSDDTYLHTRSGFGETLVDLHSMELRILAMTENTNASTLTLTIESRIDQPSGVAQIGMKNFNTQQFDPVHQYAIGTSEEVVVIEGIDATKYVNSNNGRIRVKIKHIVFIPFLAFTFESFIDQVEIVVE